MALPDEVEPVPGRVDDDDLGRFGQGLNLGRNIRQGVIESWLIFADNDNGNHRWYTSDEPLVYTRL